MVWNVEKIKGSKFDIRNVKNPVFIEGLPGIGNVGKIAVDFIVEELKAKRVYSLFSYSMPHSVFVNDKNLIELPTIEIYHTKVGKQHFLFLCGDIQPIEEVSSYEFCDTVLDLLEKCGCKEIITTGGIGLQSVPEKPTVYITGNSKNLISDIKKNTNVNDKLYGVVGPIIGVSGILLGLAEKRDIPAAALLAETFGHPMYVGLLGARATVGVIDKKYGLGINIKNLDKEISEMEKEMMKVKEIEKVTKKNMRSDDLGYIG